MSTKNKFIDNIITPIVITIFTNVLTEQINAFGSRPKQLILSTVFILLSILTIVLCVRYFVIGDKKNKFHLCVYITVFVLSIFGIYRSYPKLVPFFKTRIGITTTQNVPYFKEIFKNDSGTEIVDCSNYHTDCNDEEYIIKIINKEMLHGLVCKAYGYTFRFRLRKDFSVSKDLLPSQNIQSKDLLELNVGNAFFFSITSFEGNNGEKWHENKVFADYVYALQYYSSGEIDKAEKRLARHNTPDAVCFLKGLIYHKQESANKYTDFRNTRKYFGKASKRDFKNGNIYKYAAINNLAALEFRGKNYATADSLLSLIPISHKEINPLSFFNHIRTKLKLEKLKEAEEIIRTADNNTENYEIKLYIELFLSKIEHIRGNTTSAKGRIKAIRKSSNFYKLYKNDVIFRNLVDEIINFRE